MLVLALEEEFYVGYNLKQIVVSSLLWVVGSSELPFGVDVVPEGKNLGSQ